MDGLASSLLDDRRTNSVHPNVSAGRRVLLAVLVVLLHSLLVTFLLTGQKNVFSGSNNMGPAGSGAIVDVSLYGDAQLKSIPITPTAHLPPVAPADKSRQIQNATHASQAITVPVSSQASDAGTTSLAGQQGIDIPQSTSGAGPAAASDFQRRLLAHIETYRRYPDAAKRGRLEGVVELLFAMDRKGLVIGVWIKRSSGFPALDKEAIATVLRAQPLPPIPAELPDPLNITLPVAFGSPL